jgi:hypothetical protein
MADRHITPCFSAALRNSLQRKKSVANLRDDRACFCVTFPKSRQINLKLNNYEPNEDWRKSTTSNMAHIVDLLIKFN